MKTKSLDEQQELERLPIRVRGASVHNLKDVDVDIPSGKLVVITGLSGSGKSSLAFDTIFAEGQRQYIESLSSFARQFFRQLKRPEIESLEGLPPTLCIDQRPGPSSPRSTVATTTEIHDYLRVLFARAGRVTCYRCGTPIAQQTVEEIRDRLLQYDEGTKIVLLAPIVSGRTGSHQEVFEKIRKEQLIRVRIDGSIHDLDALPELDPAKRHTVEAVTDRIIVRPGIESRLMESLNLALKLSGDGVIASILEAKDRGAAPGEEPWSDQVFSTQHACTQCGLNYAEIEPRTFSFNSPYGACSVCDGLGIGDGFDIGLVVPDRQRSLREGAVAIWNDLSTDERRTKLEELDPILNVLNLEPSTPLKECSPDIWNAFLDGVTPHLGLLTILEKEYATATTERLAEMDVFRGPVVCRTCQGSRLRPEANSVFVGEKSIAEIGRMAIRDAADFFSNLRWQREQSAIVEPLVHEVESRLQFLVKVGLGYLTLSRSIESLSGGEHQRVRLATSLGSGLCGVCYVLDEPSVGLHPGDNRRLIDAVRELQHAGNSLLIVEHDEAMMRAADYLIDMGPGAGANGGRVVACGTPEEVTECNESPTGRFLNGVDRIEFAKSRRKPTPGKSIGIRAATARNLQGIDVDFPTGLFIAVSGVSGSGKSTLVNETLAPAIRAGLGRVTSAFGNCREVLGVDQIDKLIQIDQAPIGRNVRGCVATTCGIFDEIRKLFAVVPLAKQLGFGAGRFSFNSKTGGCKQCGGHGVNRVKTSFLPEMFVVCDTCQGKRFNHQTLQVRYRNQTIADILAMSVEEALAFFENVDKIGLTLRCLADVGLGYLPLGQRSTEISGGEAQRIKLATELARSQTSRTLYLLDEPTVGLHFADVRRLLSVLSRLVDQGNSMIVIEHNLDVIKTADWVIDLGPEGGDGGGRVVATGTPEAIANCPESVTGKYLKQLLNL